MLYYALKYVPLAPTTSQINNSGSITTGIFADFALWVEGQVPGNPVMSKLSGTCRRIVGFGVWTFFGVRFFLLIVADLIDNWLFGSEIWFHSIKCILVNMKQVDLLCRLITSYVLLNWYLDLGLSGVSFSSREISLQIWDVLAFLQQAVSVQHPMPQLEQNWPEK